MNRLIVVLTFGLSIFATTSSYLSAQILYEAAFNTDGNFENWVDFQSRLASYTVSGGVLAGTGGTTAGPHLRTAEGTFGALGLDLNSYPKVNLQIRMKKGDTGQVNGGAHYLSFIGPNANHPAGLPVINFNFTPTTANTFEVFNINVKSIVSGLGGTDGVLRSLRLDPAGPSPSLGRTFEIDYIRIVNVDPGDANLDGFVNSQDFELISDNLFDSVSVGTKGDITSDGLVNYADYRLWRDRIAALSSMAASEAIPEPATLGQLFMGGATLLLLRKRRRAIGRCMVMLVMPLSILLLVGSSTYAQVVYNAGFNTNGNLEGWTSINTGPLSASGGFLNGTNTTTDPQLGRTFDSPIGGTFSFDTLSFRVRETPLAAGHPVWDGGGIVVGLGSSASTALRLYVATSEPELFSVIDSGSNFHTVSLDISGYTGIDIDYIRLDPIGGPNSQTSSFEVDYIEVTRGPLFGDVDNNGIVDLTDKNIIRDNLFAIDQLRSQGDLTGDGVVDFNDFRQWKDFYTPLPLTAGISVPEPTILSLQAVGLAFLLGLGSRRVRKKTIITGAYVLALALPSILTVDDALAADVHWNQSSSNDYATFGNWATGFLPTADFNEVAIIGNSTVPNGTANLNTTISSSNSPGGMTLGALSGQTGTLNVNSGGNITIKKGTSTTGILTVGSSGTGVLNVVSGGSITARGLVVGGGTGSSLSASGTAVLDFRDVDDPSFASNVTLNRTTRITGPNVSFSATGNLAFGADGTFIPEITSSTHSAITVAGTATLGGKLNVEFNGHTPIAGQSWKLVDAGGIVGSFTSINVPGFNPGLGEQFFTKTETVGINHQTMSLSLEQLLVLQVDRNSHTVSITNPSATSGVTVDGYTISSPSGSLAFSSWNSLQGRVAFPGWEKSLNSNNTRFSEVNPGSSSTFAALSSPVLLGNIFNPQLTAFGVTGEDYTFQYTQPDGTNRTGVIQYTGNYPANINTLVLQVDPITGQAKLFNDSNLFSGDIQGYNIFSKSGSLLTGNGNWTSLDDQNTAGGDWRESNVSPNQLAELKLDGQTSFAINGGTTFNLGALFKTVGNGGTQDLVLQFLEPGKSEPTNGVVIYQSLSASGDFDNDGDVDGRDFLIWQRGGSPNGINSGDLALWQSGYGSSQLAAVQSIPEPSGVILTILGLLLANSGKRDRIVSKLC